MQSTPKQTPRDKSRQWPFSIQGLESRLKRHLGDQFLQIDDIQSFEIPHQRSPDTILGVLVIQYKTDQDPARKIQLILIQSLHHGVPGSGKHDWRDQSLYADLLGFMPLKTPKVVAADPAGSWLLLEINPKGRFVENWGSADYFHAIDLLAGLHDQFWGLGEDLQNFHFLDRPLDSEYSFSLQTARRGLYQLNHSANNNLAQNESLIKLLNELVNNADQIAAPLRDLPSTLLQGDFWPGNLMIYPDNTFYALDWQHSAIGPGILDLATFIQESKWWFEPLPFELSELISRYRSYLKAHRQISWTDVEWKLLWDHAVLWTFLVDWIYPLSQVDNVALRSLNDPLERVWFRPIREISNIRFSQVSK